MTNPIDTADLRKLADVYRIEGIRHAADEIDRLRAEVERLGLDVRRRELELQKQGVRDGNMITLFKGQRDEATARAERAEALLREAREALEPFYRAVFNDNGDLTVSGCHPTYDEVERGYFVRRRIDAELGEKADATG